MATRSYIGIRNADASVDYIYCHFDGYPEHNGEILTEHYSNASRVRALLELGDLSVLGKFFGEKQDFDKRVVDTCLAYGRDRGEPNVSVKNASYDEIVIDQSVDYVYIFDGDHWECHNTYGPKLINLYNMDQTSVS
jgi:hypothetical protein